jgi:2-polyprenyl-3-methyl-5-hydroxy-6-metoxy-1,4-benzoquinol methylase
MGTTQPASTARHAGEAFVGALEKGAPFFAANATQCVRQFSDDAFWLLDPLAKWSEVAYGPDIFLRAAEGYARYSKDVMNRQRLYEKTGVFNHDDQDTVDETVYESEDYMVPYMWAAVLIYAFWPNMMNHTAMLRDQFIRQVKGAGHVVELGCGHGVLGLLAAHDQPQLKVTGYDISPHAIAIARKLATASGLSGRVTHTVLNILELTDAIKHTADGVICAMLAEHLQDPRPLLASVKHMLKPGGICFFSTALESAQKDHVCEFHTESEVLAMLEASGLRVRQMVSNGLPLQPFQTYQPRALAAIVEHKR